jgi:osmoprotectant transport system substrate-binding protein
MKKRLLLLLVVIITVLLLFSACGGKKADTTIKIGSKTFTENIVLGRLAYDYLDFLGYPVEEQLGFGEMAYLRAAMDSGELSMYWEYTGTILMNFVQEEPIYEATLCYNIVKEWDKQNKDIVWLDMSDVNDTYAMVIRQDTKEKYGINTMSEFAELIKGGEPIRIAASEDYLTRGDSYPRVQEVYGYTHPKNLQITVQMGMGVEALKNGESELHMATTTDPKIISYNLFVLEDDRNAFPPYHAVITIRQDILDAHPKLAADLNRLTGLLNEDNVTAMIAKVDLDGESEADVSKAWLREVGLIK